MVKQDETDNIDTSMLNTEGKRDRKENNTPEGIESTHNIALELLIDQKCPLGDKKARETNGENNNAVELCRPLLGEWNGSRHCDNHCTRYKVLVGKTLSTCHVISSLEMRELHQNLTK